MKLQEKILELCDLFGQSELKALLQSSTFFTDPGSIKRHHSFAGGLALHSFGVFYHILRIDPDWVSPISLFKVAMIHDLSKVGTYVAAKKSQKKTDANGDPVTYTDGRGVQKFEWIDVDCFEHKSHTAPVMGHADTSIFLAMMAGVPMTDDEIMSIRWHMGRADTAGEDSLRISRAVELCRLVPLIQTADMIDSYQPIDPALLPEVMRRVDELIHDRLEILSEVTDSHKTMTNAELIKVMTVDVQKDANESRLKFFTPNGKEVANPPNHIKKVVDDFVREGLDFGTIVSEGDQVAMKDRGAVVKETVTAKAIAECDTMSIDEIEAKADAIDHRTQTHAGDIPLSAEYTPTPGSQEEKAAEFVEGAIRNLHGSAAVNTFVPDGRGGEFEFTKVPSAHAAITPVPGSSNLDRIRALVEANKPPEPVKKAAAKKSADVPTPTTIAAVKSPLKTPEPDAVKQAIASQDEFTF